MVGYLKKCVSCGSSRLEIFAWRSFLGELDRKELLRANRLERPNNVNITNGVDKVVINCDVVTGSYVPGNSSDILRESA